jgi:hypothetical protein
MKKMRRTIVWLALAGLLIATTLGGCKKQPEPPPGPADANTTQTDPNA